ncbi:MAG: class I SAM-dependent methyltransferase [Bacteroidota bacterium]
MSEFDAKAKTWDEDPTRVERARVVAEALRARIPLTEEMRVLEYGCGTGLLGLELLPSVGHMTLADTSEGMLDVLREKLRLLPEANAEALRLDLITDPLPDERYDLIVTLLTLHHIDDTEGILRKFRALCSDSGMLCVIDLDREDGSFHGGGFHGHLGFDRSKFAETAERAGFHKSAFETVCELQREVDGKMRAFPLFLLTATA